MCSSRLFSKIKTWRRFGQDSTCHGVRNIAEARTSTQMVTWSVFFLISLGLFCHQMYDCICKYLQWPVNIGIEVAFNATLLFPAVAICNANQYKITKATEMGLYTNLTMFYQLRKGLRGYITLLDHLDMGMLTTKLATRKEDMIIKCRWSKEYCGPENFTEAMTDHGLCFVFNRYKTEGNELLQVKNTGANEGLQVLINTENYENMIGPHMTSGIKVLIIDQDDILRVQDLGISVSTFTESRIGLTMSTVKNLPHPYGACRSLNLTHYDSYTFDACKRETITGMVLATCKCIPHYAPWRGKERPRNCTASELYGCMTPAVNRTFLNKLTHCTRPCEQRIYATQVSFASLSRFAAKRIAKFLKSDKLRDRVKQAELTRRRVDLHTLIPDFTQLQKFFEHNNRKSFLNVATPIKNTAKVFNSTRKNLAALLQRLQVGLKQSTSQWINQYKLTKHLTFFRTLLRKTLIAAAEGTKKVTERVMKQRQQKSPSQGPFSSGIAALWGNIINTIAALVTRVKVLEKSCDRLNGMGSEVDDIVAMLQESDYLLLNELNLHAQNLSNVLSVTMERCQATLVAASTGGGKPDTNKNIQSNASLFIESLNNARGSLNRAIGVLTDVLDTLKDRVTAFKEKSSNILMYLNQISQHIHHFMHHVESERPKLMTCRFDLCDDLDPTSNRSRSHWLLRVSKYLNTDCETDQQVSEFTKRTRQIQDEYDRLSMKEVIAQEAFEMEIMLAEMKETFNFTDFNVSVQGVEQNLHKLQVALELFQLEARVIKNYYTQYYVGFRALKNEVVKFTNSSTINEHFVRDNILSLKVFYQRLSHEDVVKSEGYGWFALLSNIGGSAGLFLGVSILSVLEFLYFIVTSIYRGERIETPSGYSTPEAETSETAM